MRNDFDRRPVSDLGFMPLRLLGLFKVPDLAARIMRPDQGHKLGRKPIQNE
jgi:hypothetical protein